VQKRRFGRTGHMSTIVIFGAYAVAKLDQKAADSVMELVLESGINHIDVAPSYHDAELRLGPWLERYRDRFFLGCKTQQRRRLEAREELHRSLERLCANSFDLYQLHAVTTMQELDDCFASGGSMEAILEARDEGLTRYVGITSHGLQAPAVEMAAMERFDFDSILFTLNANLWSVDQYRRDATALLEMAAKRDVGSMVIKAVARGPWGEQQPRYHTWYEPLDDPAEIDGAFRFALTQPVTGAISAGDARLLPMILDSAARFQPMDASEQQAYLERAWRLQPLFT
jgi:aryl-alcohol dehydrogenase-like predicted oxidoreductase